MKCLVVDESATMRRIVVNALRALGSDTILEASDGKQALELCDTDVTLVVTAWSMSVMSGVEMVRQLRENPDTARVPVLLVTTRNGKKDVLEAVAAGIQGYLLKPFTAETLKLKLEELLQSAATDDVDQAAA